MARTGVWGCDPQRGSKGQRPWWGSGGEAPWKPALLKNLNHNLYSKLIWDYYKMGCVILTGKLFNLPFFFSFFVSVFFLMLKSGATKAAPAVAVPTPLVFTFKLTACLGFLQKFLHLYFFVWKLALLPFSEISDWV